MAFVHRKRWAVLLVLLIWPAVAQVQDGDRPAAEGPREVGLTEQTMRRLAQLDVTVTGPDEIIRELSRDDFELVIANEIVPDFFVDRICSEPEAAETAAGSERPSPTAPEPEEDAEAKRPLSILLYFDQTFLTMRGRARSLEVARDLVQELVQNGNRAMIVSNGEVLTTYTALTDDVDELLTAIKTVENDRRQWDPTAITEESRIEEVLRIFGRDGYQQAAGLARRYQADERWRTDKALRRLTMVIGRLADVDPPKSIIYFADRMRSKPGLHYQAFFARYQIKNSSALKWMELDALQGMHSFDGVIDAANAQGARFYAIQAEGMAHLGVSAGLAHGVPAGASTSTHIRDAQSSLVGLARETGGAAFLRGIPAVKIARRIRDDYSCLYMISFDRSGFPEDRGLPVRVRVLREGVKAQVRGQTLFQSEEALLEARLLAAFASAEPERDAGAVHGAVIPVGFDDGKYSALVQVFVDGWPIADAVWDLGASVLSRGKVREDVSGRIEVGPPGTPVVLEHEMTFTPGPYEIVLVAHETGANQILSGQVEGSWADPNDQPATAGPVVVLQPARAAFLRDGDVRTEGPLGRAAARPVRTDLPTALVSLVCRGKGKKRGALRVERDIEGESAIAFKEELLKPGDGRCVQIRDVIRAGTMTDGFFTYHLRVLREDELLASTELEFAAGGEAEQASDSEIAPGL